MNHDNIDVHREASRAIANLLTSFGNHDAIIRDGIPGLVFSSVLGGKIKVIKGGMYTVSLFLKFVNAVPDCKDYNFGLKKHLPTTFNRDFMNNIVADEWSIRI